MMMKGQLIFVKGDSLVSRIINLVDGKYSHVAIALSDDVILEAQRFSKSRIVRNYHEVYDVVDVTLSDEQVNMLLDKSLELIGMDYDYRQVLFTLFSSLFGTPIANMPGKYICSEIIIELLHKVGYVNDADRETMNDCTPNELYEYIQYRENEINNLYG